MSNSGPAKARNVSAGEGGPGGGLLEGRLAAYYLLTMLAENEARGLPGVHLRSVKFQRGYEGHAFDDVIVSGVDRAGESVGLEVQAKVTLDFTKSDAQFGRAVHQIAVGIRQGGAGALAVAISRTNGKIERPYQQLLQLARKLPSGADLRTALDAERVTNKGMQDFASAFQAQLQAARIKADDEVLWNVLRRFQILVFDFESPGAVSPLLVEALAKAALPIEHRNRHRDLWSALVEKALSYDADGGEITLKSLRNWLTVERGFVLVPGRDIAAARDRLAKSSEATLARIDNVIGTIELDRSTYLDTIKAAPETSRFIEISGPSGTGKSGILKTLAEFDAVEGRPLVLSPARTPGGGWLALAQQLGTSASASEFLADVAASGCRTLYVDGLDRFTDAPTRETIADLLDAASQVPAMQVVVTTGSDFDEERRQWLPAAAISSLQRHLVTVAPLSDEEVERLVVSHERLALLLKNVDIQPVVRNLFLLKQLWSRHQGDALPATEAALARTWFELDAHNNAVQARERTRALRTLGERACSRPAVLSLAGISSETVEELRRYGDVDEIHLGATGSFRHDVLRDWAVGNVLFELPARVADLPLAEVASVPLARGLELAARLAIESAPGPDQWMEIVRLTGGAAHASWRRAVLLALVRSERWVLCLDRALPLLIAEKGELLAALIRAVVTAESISGAEQLIAAGMPENTVPHDYRLPINASWGRLINWALARFDVIDCPVGPDLFRLFQSWLIVLGGHDSLSLRIVPVLHSWLEGLEADRWNAPPTQNPMFAGTAHGSRRGLMHELRTTFLMFCDKSPDLARDYLSTHSGPKGRTDIVETILKSSGAVARAVPEPLSEFLRKVLISHERREARSEISSYRERLFRHDHAFYPPGPSQGPFFALLTASPTHGLQIIRELLEYGIARRGLRRTVSSDLILSDGQGRQRRFTDADRYFLARDIADGHVLYSALRALEAWGHRQVEAGRSLWEVVDDIFGADPTPAPLLGVAVDLVLTHAAGDEGELIPFLSLPELLALDRNRWNRDIAGAFVSYDDKPFAGLPSNGELDAKASRTTNLLWTIDRFAWGAREDHVTCLRDRLLSESSRLKADTDDPSVYEPGWLVRQALWRLDRNNYREQLAQLEDGRKVTVRQYAETPEEQETLAPLRARSEAESTELATMILSVQAAVDPNRRDEELLERVIGWAQRQDSKSLGEDEGDFERSQRWRAVVAAATIAAEANRDEAWSTAILERAIGPEAGDDRRSYNDEIRYHGPALATIGWIALASREPTRAHVHLLELAIRGDRPIITALGSSLDRLHEISGDLAQSIVRLAFQASIYPERHWDDAEADATAKANRETRLCAAVAAELAWLQGIAPKPAWPDWPRGRRVKQSQAGKWEEEEQEPEDEAMPESWVNDHESGAWLRWIARSTVVRETDWVGELMDHYRGWTLYAWGQGLHPGAEIADPPLEWLRPFIELSVRRGSALPGQLSAGGLASAIVTLPDESFLDAAAIMLLYSDALHIDKGEVSVSDLIALREQFLDRLLATRFLQWSQSEKTETIITDLAELVAAFLCHSWIGFGPARCYAPEKSATLLAITAPILALVRAVPGWSVVTGLFLTLWERGQDWLPVDELLDAAEAWASIRGTEPEFWRDGEFGDRIVAWIKHYHARGVALGTRQRERLIKVADLLAKAGVSSALELETRLAATA